MRGHHRLKYTRAIMAAGLISLTFSSWASADVQPGTVISKDNMAEADALLIPAMKWFVQNGMKITVAPYRKVEMPKLYKEATEKYSGQVKLSADGREIYN